MNKSHHPNHKVNFALGAQLLVLLSIGCSGDLEPEQAFRADEVALEAEASLESALRTLDADDIVITYDEGTSAMDVRVDLKRFEELARGFTVEASLELKAPDGTVARHELVWTSGDELEVPRIALPAAERGRYEVVLTSLAIDGRIVPDAPALLQSTELVEEGSPAARELQVRAPDDGVKYWFCDLHTKNVFGTPGDDTLYGGKKTRDSIHGYEGNDVLISGKCADQLWGDEGNDVLRPGTGVDTCFGGPGDDQFVSCEFIVDDGADHALVKSSHVINEEIETMQASDDVRESYGIVAYESSADDSGVTSVRGIDEQERVVLEVRYGDGGLYWRGFAVEPFTVDESLTVDPEGRLVELPVVNESMPAKMEEVLDDLTSGELIWPLGNCWTLGGQCAVQALAAGLCVPVCSSGNVAACVGCVVQTAPGLYTTCEEYVTQCL